MGQGTPCAGVNQRFAEGCRAYRDCPAVPPFTCEQGECVSSRETSNCKAQLNTCFTFGEIRCE